MQRPLTGFEKAFCLSEPAVPLNFCLVAQLYNPPSQENIHAALQVLARQYSMALVRLAHTADGEPIFTDEDVSVFPLRIEEGDDLDWQQVAVEELGMNFDLQNGPLIRLVLVKNPENAALILTFHHGIADGMSAFFFLKDLFALLANPLTSLEGVNESKDVVDKIPAQFRNTLPGKIQLGLMKAGLRIMKWSGIGFPPADRQINGKPPWEHIRLLTRKLTQAQTQTLAVRCKEEETSVQGAICAAWLLARNEIFQLKQTGKRKLSIPVNLRDLLGAGKSFGMVMSNAVVTAACSPDQDFWGLSRQIKNSLLENIEDGKVYQWITVMQGMMDVPSDTIKLAVPSFAVQPPGYDFSISNLGRVSFDQSEQVSGLYGPIVNTSEQELTVGIVTLNNELTLSFVFRDFVLPVADAEAIADQVLQILRGACHW